MGTALVGALLYVAKKPLATQKSRTSLRDSYAIVAYGWIVATVFGMLPYLLTGTFDTVTDAFFETMSGLTTVGASVLDDIEGTAKCVLLWRSLTHWLGGMGILVLFVALLTGQGTGAMQIFKAESSGPVKSKLQPKMVETARILWLIYVANTILVILLYGLAGMNLFDAVNHGFSAISTGGFLPKISALGIMTAPGLIGSAFFPCLLPASIILFIFMRFVPKVCVVSGKVWSCGYMPV